ncbi:conserved Plasmodium protein, unknown function [Plasmodium knowlesi strain H]|uniref:PI31 proteasome regulator N-terminal domain-containing protein n=3 Tax=Plasmodium knowlesi TaxID=5850 RepID=A0A5K1UIP5_PLAKH|nr:PI31 domain-containing protein, putative [Plasmodium knowlesi strain H]OTN65823.1 Uncharacterized protein PKNOH_S100037900 [Plasmodium knowlesi]CAA9987742.1 PI31 domain-containing protein, putative [Plasmodium knowlesi strain H]SBO27064.1 conserved Plasmodium protein, unknown function [Plasmodium knowlesi strain H]SBO29454.1 conserved Plasmodium protein, unknown function [Plasmodium knowlesi strain H]VVS77216.1 PI31 domain-containing protein, putative [Plasmodium knowlesi strain H]|eukprot:XP_002258739.1 hypothetical protein, conserved in Plasmodium species [Plasmodium knowlesi strain H]
MAKHNTFKDLVKLHEDMKKEELVVLFFHSCILDNNFIYKLNDEKKYEKSENYEKIKISNGYIKHMIDSEKGKFFLSRILIDPEWRSNSSSYNFLYKSVDTNDTYNLNLVKIENSLVVQIINTAQPCVVHSVTIDVDKYVNKCTVQEGVKDNMEEHVQMEQLEQVFQAHILSHMKKKNSNNMSSDNSSNKGKGLIIESNANEHFRNTFHTTPDPYLLPNYNDNHFDDKNPNIGRNLIPDLRNNIPILRPDGLLVGPDNKFFNPKNLRYDPIGPFGNEPNADNKPFDFQNNFPF